MELRHIRYFIEVAEAKSFSQAAKNLGISQPPLSMQIKDLEEEIGASLFVRHAHGVSLTDAGKAFLQQMQPLQHQLLSAIQQAKHVADGQIGELRLGFTGTSMLNPLVVEAIRRYQQLYPEVQLKLKEANSIVLIEAIARNELDIAILRPPERAPVDIRLQHLLTEAMVVALPVNFPHDADVIDLLSLKDQPFILSPQNVSAGLYDAIIAACQRRGFQPMIGQFAPQIVSMLSLVAANLGVSLVPESTQHLNIRGVKYCTLSPAIAQVDLALAHKIQDYRQTAVNFASVLNSLCHNAMHSELDTIASSFTI